MTIYLDLDNTLIDTEKIRRIEARVAGRYGIQLMTYLECADLTCIQDPAVFTYERVYDILREYYLDLPRSLISDLYQVLKIRCFTSYAFHFLSKFRKQDLVLVSSGDPAFQRMKIETHRIADYVREIHIVNEKASVITRESPPVFFVDDAPRHIEAVGRAHPWITCIRVHEPPSWEVQQEIAHPHVYIESLFDVAEYIKRMSMST
jgi:FMN phosphatase YigB (HAD superfamily)